MGAHSRDPLAPLRKRFAFVTGNDDNVVPANAGTTPWRHTFPISPGESLQLFLPNGEAKNFRQRAGQPDRPAARRANQCLAMTTMTWHFNLAFYRAFSREHDEFILIFKKLAFG